MATRSVIGIMHGDVCKAIYCHWDGYISNNGVILFNHYKDSVKVNELIANGYLSSLGQELGVKHEFQNPHEFGTPKFIEWSDAFGHMCTFYGRDRGDGGVDHIVVNSAKELFDAFDWCEYFYVMKDGVWYVSSGNEWTTLEQAIIMDSLEN